MSHAGAGLIRPSRAAVRCGQPRRAEEEDMAYTQRKQEIINLLKNSDEALSIDLLCDRIYASRSTIRRDLIQMENEGLIVRHFGAVSLTPSSSKENTAVYRGLENTEKKTAIARSASTLLHDNMVLFLDSSSTASYLVPYLSSHENLTVITNSIDSALKLNSAAGVTCFLCPGKVKHNSYSIIGDFACTFLDNFRADLAILSCKAISLSGLYEGDDAQAMIKRHMMQQAEKTVALCDSTKENCQGFIRLCTFQDIHLLISDSPFSETVTAAVKEAGCSLITGDRE